jgi:hypothetical protein
MTDESVWNALQSSGFPFQTAVRHMINPSVGWQLRVSEYPWRAPGGDDRFLDIVAIKGTVHLCIECKKTRKERFIFLLPVGQWNTGVSQNVRCLRVRQMPAATKGPVYCETWAVSPSSKVAEFCIVSTSESGRDQRMLEADARGVVQGSNAFAEDVADQGGAIGGGVVPKDSFIVPVIVTNGPIYTARYKPTEISLESGEFVEQPKEIDRVPWVRFQKAFTSSAVRDVGERTVFVVQAESLNDFLKAFSFLPAQTSERMSVRIR